jgi:glycine/D-amino acid oxidase-like deaminating enzyme
MSPPVGAVVTESRPAAVAEVVLIGGRMAGVAAYHLAKRGTSVALIEKGAIAGEQSRRDCGWWRQRNRDPRELPLSHLALPSGERLAEISEEGGSARASFSQRLGKAASRRGTRPVGVMRRCPPGII